MFGSHKSRIEPQIVTVSGDGVRRSLENHPVGVQAGQSEKCSVEFSEVKVG